MNQEALFVLVDVNAAKAKYPAAWRCIEAQMVEVRAASNAHITPFVAQVVVVKGVETLKVTASTDLMLDSESSEPVSMVFLAPTSPPQPLLSLVPATGGSKKD